MNVMGAGFPKTAIRHAKINLFIRFHPHLSLFSSSALHPKAIIASFVSVAKTIRAKRAREKKSVQNHYFT
jgi:hypothetical protein